MARKPTEPLGRPAAEHLLAAAVSHLHSVSRALGNLPHQVLLRNAKGQVLYTVGDSAGGGLRWAKEPIRLPAEGVAGRVEVGLATAGDERLHAAFAAHLADSIAEELAAQNRGLMLVTQQRQHELAALQLAAIVESSEDAIIGKDLDGIITTWNAGAERMYGYTAREAIGSHISLLTPRGRKHEVGEFMRRLRAGEAVAHYETQRLRKDGEVIDVALSISPIHNPEGEIVGASSIARDITERKRAEHALRVTEKLAATGRLAASIAHEINNPMASVTNLLYLLEHHPTLDKAAGEYVRMAQEEIHRVTHIVRQMLGFYREAQTPVEVNLKGVLEDVLLLYARRIKGAGIQVTQKLDPGTTIHAYPGEIRQVVSNLAINAIEAAGENGRLWVGAHPSRDWARPQRTGVRIMICDNGPGIAREYRRHIFEPFFTTKGERGTGLGLWVTEGIVRKHGGTIRLRSSTRPELHGTCFEVFLPYQTAARPAASETKTEPAAPARIA